MSSKNALIIFAKNPELGKVKTRLAKEVGDEEALAIYHKLLAWTQRETFRVSATCIVYYTSSIDDHDPWKANKKLQADGDLGQKMSSAFQEQLTQFDKVCIIGTDCAGLTTELIDQAFAAMDANDIVLGPANDGGYYLLGMKTYHQALFEEIAWSSELVLSQTIKRINTLKKSYQLLPELIDVDTIEDWNLVKDNFR